MVLLPLHLMILCIVVLVLPRPAHSPVRISVDNENPAFKQKNDTALYVHYCGNEHYSHHARPTQYELHIQCSWHCSYGESGSPRAGKPKEC